MGSILAKKYAVFGAIIIAGLGAASPAMAGRCGHSYAVDAPTTLAKVARACNVSYAALLEANRGVDPSYVAPGEHLAVPDESAEAPSGIVSVVTTPADSTGQYATPVHSTYSSSDTAYRSYYDDRGDGVQLVNARVEPKQKSYLDTDYTPVHTRREARLSFQKAAAVRIRSAGVTQVRSTGPLQMQPIGPSAPTSLKQGHVVQVSTAPTSLVECIDVEEQADSKIRQVKLSAPAGAAPVSCITAAKNEAEQAIMVRSSLQMLSPTLAEEPIKVLRGYISAVDAECMTLRSDDGGVWRISAPIEATDMVGRDATIWMMKTSAAQCGGLAMNHAVYIDQF